MGEWGHPTYSKNRATPDVDVGRGQKSDAVDARHFESDAGDGRQHGSTCGRPPKSSHSESTTLSLSLSLYFGPFCLALLPFK